MTEEAEPSSAEKGKQRDEILFSFFAIGIAQLVLGGWLMLIEIIVIICASTSYPWMYNISLISPGIWCGVISIPAGIMSIAMSKKVTYFSIGWSLICSVVGAIFMLLLVCLSLAAAIQATMRINAVIVFNIILLISSIAQFTLCCYNSVVFGRLYTNYPHHVSRDNVLCPCCWCKSGPRDNFAHVMYSTIAPKKHDH